MTKKPTKNRPINIRFVEPSIYKRKALTKVLKKDGYKRDPYRGAYADENIYWYRLTKGNVNIYICW